MVSNLIFGIRKASGKANGEPIPSLPADQIANGILPQAAITALSACLVPDSGVSCTDETRKTLCDAFLSQRGNPFVEGNGEVVGETFEKQANDFANRRMLSDDVNGNVIVHSAGFDVSLVTDAPTSTVTVDVTTDEVSFSTWIKAVTITFMAIGFSVMF